MDGSESEAPLDGPALTDAISAEMSKLYSAFYGHDRAKARTYVNDNVVVCILENILTASEAKRVEHGEGGDVIDERITFQEDSEDEFTEAIERLTRRSVTAFLSGNQTYPGIACELFFLDDGLTLHT